MRIPTLMLLGATGMVATGLAVWMTVEPATAAQAGKAPAAGEVDTAEPAKDALAEPVLDLSQFTAGKTLMVEGRLGHKVLPVDLDSETFLYLDISADAAGRARKSVPLNLAIVVDRSGSMKGKRLHNAMAATRSAIERLRDGDVVSVVTYSTTAETIVEPTMIDSLSRARIIRELDKPRASGDTCISCGVDAGMALLGAKPGMVSRILLLSDGLATAGVRDLPGFARIAENCRRMGASITTIGVDVDYDERILAALARDSNGGHFFVDNAAGLPAILDKEMDGLTRTIANSAELTIDLAPGVTAEQVYDRVVETRGSQLVVPLGAFTAGERKTLLVRLRIPRTPAGERPVAAVRLRYDDLVEDRPGSCDGALAAQISSDPKNLVPLDGLVSARVSTSETADALETANAMFRDGRREEARQLLQRNAAQLDSRRKMAKVAAPAARAPDVDAAFDKQAVALDGARNGFEEPAPTAAADPGGSASGGGSAGASDDRERAGKAQTRKSQEDAFNLDQ